MEKFSSATGNPVKGARIAAAQIDGAIRRGIGIPETMKPDKLLAAVAVSDSRIKITGAVCIVLAAASIMFGLAMVDRVGVAKARLHEAAGATARLPLVQKGPASSDVVSAAAEVVVSGSPSGITVDAPKDGTVTIRASDAAMMDSWLGAIARLQVSAPNVRWSIMSLCVGAKCQSILSARFRAESLSITPGA